MKYRAILRRVVGVLCVVLLTARVGWARPSGPDTTYPPPVNCSTSWTPERRPRNSPSAQDVEVDPVLDDDFQDLDLSSSRFDTPSSGSSWRSKPLYLTAADGEYFDYLYEEPGDSLSDFDHVPDGGPTPQHQPPPGLNRVAKLKLLKTPRRQPPEYMLELYDRFSRGKVPMPSRNPKGTTGNDDSDLGADIVRSFPNINKEGEF